MNGSPLTPREKLKEARLYLILTRDRCRLPPLALLGEALQAGVDLVQVREPGLEEGALLEWAFEVVELARPCGVPVIVNDRPWLAREAGADGAHVGQEDLSPREARTSLGAGPLLGFSTHNRAQVLRAAREDVDYLGLGPFFASATKVVAPLGPRLLLTALAAASRPVFGIGGITLENLPVLIEGGLRRIAVCSAICAASDPGRVARRFKSALPPVR